MKSVVHLYSDYLDPLSTKFGEKRKTCCGLTEATPSPTLKRRGIQFKLPTFNEDLSFNKDIDFYIATFKLTEATCSDCLKSQEEQVRIFCLNKAKHFLKAVHIRKDFLRKEEREAFEIAMDVLLNQGGIKIKFER